MCLCVSLCGYNLMESILSFQHAGARVQTQVMWLGSKCLYPLIYLSGPNSPLFCVESGPIVEYEAGQFQLVHLGIKNKIKQSLNRGSLCGWIKLIRNHKLLKENPSASGRLPPYKLLVP